MKIEGNSFRAKFDVKSASRAQLDRVLDPNNDSVTLATLSRAAQAVGRTIRLELA